MNRKTFLRFTGLSNFVMISMMIFPLGLSIWLGMHFMTWNTINEPEFVGLANFLEVLSDPKFWAAFRWTMWIILITVPAHVIIGFVMALLLDQVKGPMRPIFITGMLLPMIVVPVVGSIVFKKLFEPAGLAFWFFRVVLDQQFVFNEITMKTIILAHTTWLTTPYAFMILFAGLQTLPPEQIEAAAMDGASRFQQTLYVVIPHLRTLFMLIFLMSIMDMFRLFDNVFVLTGQNPIYNADSLMTYNFRISMMVRRLGLGNAMAVLTVIAILVVLIPFLIFTYREQIEER